MPDKPTLDDAIEYFQKCVDKGSSLGEVTTLAKLKEYRDSLQPRPELPGEMWGLWDGTDFWRLEYGLAICCWKSRDAAERAGKGRHWLPVRLYPRPDSRFAEVLREARNSSFAGMAYTSGWQDAVNVIALRLTELGLLEEKADDQTS